MAKVEIDESELANLRSVNAFAEAALKNPKTRRNMLGIQKTLNPDAAIPEIDATEHVMQQVKGVEDKMDALLAKLDARDSKTKEDENNRNLSARVQAGQKLLRDNGYQADGIEKIEKLMLEEGIGSYAAGLALFERLNPPARPADASTSRWGSMSDQAVEPTADDYKDLWDSKGQSDKWVEDSIRKVRTEFRN